ncbi:hypothetical protein LBWT_55090 [Leptolyngbya boryana IAM M-101]|jgi:hypothetical protein|nr:hypothetical protein LBWT_55090 [Leptolyngbya boryana IAM M-101]BAS65885.1 hypothetical protein LBDG_55090 [Leptolyngbya boryana dg5]
MGMSLNDEMSQVFEQQNLVYAYPESLDKINLSPEIKESILSLGLPIVIGYLRFSMDFEPIAEDVKFHQPSESFGNLFTIGCRAVTQLIGRFIHLDEIGLDGNASLSRIAKKLEELDLDEAIFSAEVNLANRICLDLDNGNRIVYINPIDKSIGFCNSSLEQLAASIVAYEKSSRQYDDVLERLDSFSYKMQVIDSAVFNHEDGLWLSIIKQLKLDDEGY